MAIFLKDPGSSIDYAVDWGAGYLAGQTIAASAWSVAPDTVDGVHVTGAITAPSRTMATFAGGVPGRVYRVANRVTLSDGRTDERSVTLRVEDR